jgi:hypothetical protein
MAVHVTVTEATLAPAIVPVPAATLQTCADGWECTLMAYAALVARSVAKTKVPFVVMRRSSPPLLRRTSVPFRPETLPPTENVELFDGGGAGGGAALLPPPLPPPHPCIASVDIPIAAQSQKRSRRIMPCPVRSELEL